MDRDLPARVGSQFPAARRAARRTFRLLNSPQRKGRLTMHAKTENQGNSIVTLPSDTEIAVTRFFAAPPERVFDAWTQPQLVRRWLLGPPGWTMPVCEIDLRP